jgi:hypothetical protein
MYNFYKGRMAAAVYDRPLIKPVKNTAAVYGKESGDLQLASSCQKVNRKDPGLDSCIKNTAIAGTPLKLTEGPVELL